MSKEMQSFYNRIVNILSIITYGLMSLHLFVLRANIVVLGLVFYTWIGRAFFVFSFVYGFLGYIPGQPNLLQAICLLTAMYFSSGIISAALIFRIPKSRDFYFHHFGKDFVTLHLDNVAINGVRMVAVAAAVTTGLTAGNSITQQAIAHVAIDQINETEEAAMVSLVKGAQQQKELVDVSWPPGSKENEAHSSLILGDLRSGATRIREHAETQRAGVRESCQINTEAPLRAMESAFNTTVDSINKSVVAETSTKNTTTISQAISSTITSAFNAAFGRKGGEGSNFVSLEGSEGDKSSLFWLYCLSWSPLCLAMIHKILDLRIDSVDSGWSSLMKMRSKTK